MAEQCIVCLFLFFRKTFLDMKELCYQWGVNSVCVGAYTGWAAVGKGRGLGGWELESEMLRG